MNGKKLLPVALILAGLAVGIPTERALRSFRAATTTDASGTSWVRYVMVGFGGFRGVVSEVLWIRAADLQEEGRYFELIQLADWITALDPRADEAWVFNAWNLSYNIPAMLPDPNARLSWVRAGLSLLADKAIPANPATPRLYRELGWLYQNKIGSADDTAHKTYKLALAAEFADRDAVIGEAPGAKLDKTTVTEIETTFGPLDWRLAPSHAVYWAWRGLKCAQKKGFEREALRRMVRQNLFTLVSEGKFTGDLDAGTFTTAPDYDIVKGLIAFCEETVNEDPTEKRIYALTLARLIGTLSRAGHQEECARLYGRFSELLTSLHIAVPSYSDVVAGKGVQDL